MQPTFTLYNVYSDVKVFLFAHTQLRLRRKDKINMQNKIQLSLLIITILLLTAIIPKTAIAKAPAGSMIGNVHVAGQEAEQIEQSLEVEIALWQSKDDLILTSDFENLTIPREVIIFDIDATISEFQERTKRKLTSFFMKPKNVHIPLHVSIDENHDAIQNVKELSYIDTDTMLLRLKEVASELNDMELSIVYFDESNIPMENVVEVSLNIPSLSNAVINYAIDKLDGAVIGADETFSFLHAVEFPEAILATEKEMSFIGSALYELFLQANFDIVERHAHERVPGYTEAGLDARISEEEERDLVAHNRDDVSYKVSLERKGEALHVALQSTAPKASYEYEKVKEEEIEQRTIYRYSKDLEPGEQQVIQAGKKGLTVETRRNEYSENNVFIDYEVISKDVYLPIPAIILMSSEEESDEADETVDGEDLDESLDELEESLDDFDDFFEWDDPDSPDGDSINIVPIDQLEALKEEQKKLRNMIDELAEIFELLDEQMNESLKEQQEKFDELFKLYDSLLEQLLNDN